MNKHEAIADARRIRLRQMLSELSQWANERTKYNGDTEKTLAALETKTKEIQEAVEQAGNQAEAECFGNPAKLPTNS